MRIYHDIIRINSERKNRRNSNNSTTKNFRRLFQATKNEQLLQSYAAVHAAGLLNNFNIK